jgi:eukaryotic-like serine/threonine-protein kinase
MIQTSSLPEPGTLLVGKYRVERLLGQGGMGAVYAAQDEVLCRRVALKLLLTDTAQSPDGLQRFLNEARAAARLDSEHVARVMDFGRLDSGLPFMVLEYLEGEDLAQVLQSRGALPVPEVVDYVLQACEALAHAHAAGIVHRDLKPSNLFLARRGDGTSRIKVLDFGISKVSDQSLAPKTLTAAGGMLGTPSYMSPEQIATPKKVDSRTDIWQLGVCLYELLTRSPPFMRESLGELIYAIVNDGAPAVTEKRPEVPAELDRAIRRCLARDASRRFANVAQLAERIAPFGSGANSPLVGRIAQTFSAQPAPFALTPGSPKPPTTPTTTNPWKQSSGETMLQSRTQRRFVVAGALIVSVAIAGGVWAILALRVRPQAAAAESVSAPASVAVSPNAPARPALPAPAAFPTSPTAKRAADAPSPEPVVAAAPPPESLAPRTAVADAGARPRKVSTPSAGHGAAAPPASSKPPTPAPPLSVAHPADQLPDNSRQ